MADTAVLHGVKMRFGEPPKTTRQRRVLPKIPLRQPTLQQNALTQGGRYNIALL